MSLLWLFSLSALSAQNAQWVNPLIGTGRCDVSTLWGNYGGTYPGAVAPWGMVQLTPETSVRPGETGYYYEDTTLLSFSCLSHASGYPNGSAGRLHFSFHSGPAQLVTEPGVRSFSHADEVARPGYYRLSFGNGDRIEMTATTHTGLYRYHSEEEQTVVWIYRGGALQMEGRQLRASHQHAIIRFDKPYRSSWIRNDTACFVFDRKATSSGLNILLSASETGFRESESNAQIEVPCWDFDTVSKATYQQWDEELACVAVEGGSTDEKTKFYTALYHSFLIPTLVSDAVESPVRYARYSPWDTFRSLHPLLSLLKPERHWAMIHTLMDQYRAGKGLPKGPMSGFHIIPVLLDAAVKGITDCSHEELYKASAGFFRSYATNPYVQDYLQLGYVRASHDRSVSITSELAYNEWTLSRLAHLAQNEADSHHYAVQSYAYRHLFDEASGFLLPREGDTVYRNTGEMGYQESTKWTASYFVPHNVQDLINLSGGAASFVSRLQQAFEAGRIVFDNEPVLHYPYLFSWAGRPDLTIDYVHQILQKNYRNSPGGIPGNDDLGSMSSWLVLSAMGLYPACPGTGEYLLSEPIFDRITLRVQGKEIELQKRAVRAKGTFPSVYADGISIQRSYLTHQELMSSRTILFDNRQPVTDFSPWRLPYSETRLPADFRVAVSRPLQKHILSGKNNRLPFAVTNVGSDGVFIARLLEGDSCIATKNIRVMSGETCRDTLDFICYRQGKHSLSLLGNEVTVHVAEDAALKQPFRCRMIRAASLVKRGDSLSIAVEVQNRSSRREEQLLPLRLNGQEQQQIEVALEPGEARTYRLSIPMTVPGFCQLELLETTRTVKVYEQAAEACLLHLDYASREGSRVKDLSGFDNHAVGCGALQWEGHSVRTGERAYLQLPRSESLMTATRQLTLLTWIAPQTPIAPHAYADFFTKGDYTLLKMEGPNSLVFFAGGWGGGMCQIEVPADWYGHWHLVAGVCTGDTLQLFLDGVLMQEVPVQGDLVETEVGWSIGRNEEMPFSRFSDMKLSGTRIFGTALSAEEIERIYQEEKRAIDL